jgi:hypothetical protein
MIRRRVTRETNDLMAELDPELLAIGASRGLRGKTVRMLALYRAGARRELNAIVFPAKLQREGLSLAALLSMPQQELVGVIPDYQGLREGDTVTAIIHHRSAYRTAVVGTICVCNATGPLTFRYSREVLEQFGMNGRLEFSYEIVNAKGDVTERSPTTTLMVRLHDMQERLSAPQISCSSDGVVREVDIVPALAVDIPLAIPEFRSSDRVHLRIGDGWFEPLKVGRPDGSGVRAATLLVPCDDVLRILEVQGTGAFSLEAAYDIETGGVLIPSEVAVVTFDLSGLMAGG